MTDISLTIATVESVTADVLVVPLLKGEDSAPASPVGLPSLADAFAAVNASGGNGSVAKIPAPSSFGVPVILGVGLGESTLEDVSVESIRTAFGSAVRALQGVGSAALSFPAADAAQLAAALEGAAFGAYNYLEHKSKATEKKTPLQKVSLLVADKKEQKALAPALERARLLAEGVHLVRDLVNTPSNLLFPESFAQKAKELTKKLPIEVEVLDEKALTAGGYGGIVGVGQGSHRGPRLVKLTYSPRKASRHVALVGKGITFDTGGISIKPAAGMEDMTMDMGGAAAVLGATVTAAALGLDVKVTTFLALAENMPGGGAQRPGDVVTMRNGTTVEVLNTDAEGRMVMADALVDAAALEPDLLIDVATLTGAAMVALGSRTAAIMGTDEARALVVEAAEASGEAMWPMPFPSELREALDGRVADLRNIGDRMGGALSAGIFLSEFVEDVPWAHIDIAGPAFTSKAHGYTPVGGTGVSLRTLVEVLEREAGK
ncbi:MAG: leucyl aminopeptidase [Dermabacter sp.]|nr:leucyl aminopeptidase [Dermabacter sp.]